MKKICTLDYKKTRHFFLCALDIVDEIKLCFDEIEVYTKVVDPAHVAMRHIQMPKGLFVKKNYIKPFEVEINIETIRPMFKKQGKKDDTVEMYIVDEKFYIATDDLLHGFTIQKGIVSSVHIPKLNPNHKFEADVEQLKTFIKTVREAKIDYITLISKNGTDTLKFIGSNVDNTVQYDTKYIPEGSVCCLYSTNYTYHVIKRLDCETVDITMDTDYPITFKTDEPIPVTYLLAPRIES